MAAMLLAATTLLLGCQTPPTAPAAGLEQRQIAALLRAGFTLTDEGWGLNLDGPILFDSNDDQLSERAHKALQQLTETLRSVDIDNLRVEGHADNTGSERHNQALSQRRADAVAKAIAEYGIPYDNIVRRGLGSAHPVADNASAEGRAQNRRVAIIVPAG
ncbi:OmpA family protein [Azoarcus indigens]|nr:OmpA family protein [Azoarcus indigens]